MAVESCSRCNSRAINRSGVKRWCATCGRDMADDPVAAGITRCKCGRLLDSPDAPCDVCTAYERGRADERAEICAWLRAYPKDMPLSLAHEAIADAIDAGAAKKGGAT